MHLGVFGCFRQCLRFAHSVKADWRLEGSAQKIQSILSYFISFSTNFISSKQNIKTVNEKIKLIELELDYLQKYALSINAFINLDANNKFQNLDKIVLNKNSFHECINKSNLNNFFIFPSARTSEILIRCKINDRDYDLFINNNGIVKLNE